MEKVGALLLLAGIVGLVSGGQAVYTVATNWTPTTMECSDYFREKPSAKWLKLESCELDLENAYNFSYLGLYVSEVLVPVRPSGSKDPTIYVLLSTEGDSLEELAERLEKVKEAHGEAPPSLTLENRPELVTQSSVEGLVRFGLELDNDDEEKIEDAVKNLAKDWVLLDEGKVPDRYEAFSRFGLGIALLPISWFIMNQGDSQKRSRSRAPRSTQASGPGARR